MSTIGATAAQDVWRNFFSRVDTNADGAMSAAELSALSSSQKAGDLIKSMDTNGDGQLQFAELPQTPLNRQMMGPLLSAQEYRDATPAARAADNKTVISDLFARADVDGDGTLSQAEWDAERAINMASWLDTGESPPAVFIVRQNAEQGALKPEDFVVGRAMKLDSSLKVEDMPEDLREQMEKIKARMDELAPEVTVKTTEQVRAEAAAKVQTTPMSSAFMTRLIMSLSEGIAPTGNA
jgi:uncharacterized protein YbjT (DUF2867 family)